MAMDERDYEWRCGCGHTNPDFSVSCSGCGESRFSEIDREERAIAEAADHVALVDDHDHLLDPDDGPADWHADDPPRLPDDEGPTREKYDAEADFAREVLP
jgi:hypothetical protein